MRHNLLKMSVLMVLAFTANLMMAQTFTYPVKGKQGFHLTEKTRDGLRISYNLGEFSMSQVNYRGEEMTEISIAAIALPNAAGCPNLPTESRMMAIPQGANAKLNVVSFETETFQNINLSPALRVQTENEEPDMNYVKDMKVYGKNAKYPENPFVMGNSYIRGVDAVTVAITPFQYNPVTKELTVYTNIELSVSFEGGNGHFGDDALRSPYWDPILAAELMNYDQLPVIDYEARMQQWLRDDADGAEYLIITPNNDAWAPYANQLKEFRTRQGIITKVYRLDEMPANNTTAMKTWFHEAYNSWTIKPVAVCLLGDHGTNMSQYIPAELTSHPYSGSCITDNFYSDVSGDNLPDMVFSRLIAENPSELPVFVGKQLEYEYENPNMDPSFYSSPVTALGWQTERWFQICSEVFGGYMRTKGYTPNRINCIYQGTPNNTWSSAQNTNQVVNFFGPNGTGYIPNQPSELGDWNSGSPELVVQAINNGSFWLQHRDHGLETGWGEPAVRNSHVAQMNNVGKLPFVMSINCLTGKFNYSSDCFCEAWMRHTFNGQNAGAVGLLCPTETSYSFVNDAYVWGVYDLFDGNFMPDYGPFAPAGEKTGNWLPAFGNVAGKYFLAQCSWPYNFESKDITYTMFTAHCDPFLRIFTQVPEEMDVTHPEVILVGQDEINISAPEGNTISLVKQNVEGEWEILAVATAIGEMQTVHFEPQIPPTVVHIVITGQNYLRYEDTMEVIPSNGPYIVLDTKTVNDENGNNQVDFNESVTVDVTLKNVGMEPISGFEAVLNTTSEYITITNNTAQFGSINPGDTQTLTDAFSFVVSDNVPDNTLISFSVSVTNGEDVYTSYFNVKAYAPSFKLGAMSITEINGNGNHRLDPGETANLNFSFENKGHTDALATTASLLLTSPFVTVTATQVDFNDVAAGTTKTASFQVSIAENTPLSYILPMILEVTSGNYTSTKDYYAKVGLVVEDFESGTLSTGWQNDLTAAWQFDTSNPYEGHHCLRSGTIGHNTDTQLTLTHEAGDNDTISFYYKVSSESNYDKLHFYIDNQEKNNWSGTIDWTKASYPVSSGTHTYRWIYDKDVSVSSGSDCAWIDFVILPTPSAMSGTAGLDLTICEGNDAQIVGYAAHHESLLWTTSGDGTFDDATIAAPVYTPGPQDIIDRQVTLTITINGTNNQVITDDMILTIIDNIVIENAMPDMHYCAIDEPQEVGIQVSGDYVSFNWATSGDGVFANETEMITTYTPGPGDIANGVTLSAIATSEGCGTLTFDYPFEMTSAPALSVALPNCIVQVCQGEDLELPYEAEGFVDGTMTVEINGEPYTIVEGQPLMLTTSALDPDTYSFEFHNLSNGACMTDPDFTYTVSVIETPGLTVANPTLSICEGETAVFEFTATGGEVDHPAFTIFGDAIDAIEFDGYTYTYEVTPEQSTEIHLNQIVATLTGCAEQCVKDLDITLSVIVNPIAAQPAISGDNQLDIYYTPTTLYTVSNDVEVSFSLDPEEAGTVVNADDNKSATISWNTAYKGEVVLTATPVSTCNEGGSELTITVNNSTSVGEQALQANVFPNPVSGQLTIEAEGMTLVTLYNALGQTVYRAEVNADRTLVDTSSLPNGSYVVRIATGNGIVTRHINVLR